MVEAGRVDSPESGEPSSAVTVVVGVVATSVSVTVPARRARRRTRLVAAV